MSKFTTASRFLGLLGLLGLSGLLAATTIATAEPHEAFTRVDGVWQRSPHGCGTPQSVLADPTALGTLPAAGLRTVYLNKNGGMYTRAVSTDATTNRVNNQILQGTSGSTFTIPALNTATFNWPAISACVKTHFMRYSILFVETEPTSGTYIEAVVGGTGQEAGFPPNALFGIAAADNFCNVTEQGIAFNFSETHKNVPRRDEELCATIAHELGHLLALEHEQLPIDLLSYVLIANSNTKAFVDQASGCGTSPTMPDPCSCSGGTTNSHARLGQFIGLRGLEVVPPTINIDAPGASLRVPPTFEIVATATDDAMMGDVLALIDDVEIGNDLTAEGNVYKIMATNVPEGDHQLSVIARDAAGNTSRKDLAITVKKLATGETCASNEICSGGICAQSLEGNFCTETCDLKASTCPDDFECTEITAGSSVCVASEGGCGCSSSGGTGPMILLVLGVGALLFRRRR